MFRFLVVAVLLFSLSCGAKGQEVLRNTGILNYQRGDRVLLHFGFAMGANYMDYRLDFSGKNALRGETGELEVGFLLGIISELRITEDLGLRFLPGLEFATRKTVFTHVPDGYVTSIPDPDGVPPVKNDNKVENFNESVYITLPLMLKYKAVRINNFRPYITAGPCFKYDFQRHNTINPSKAVYFRTKPKDLFLETGVGCDFYLPYFKFGVELRFSLGLKDVLVKEYDVANPGYEIFTDALNRVNARMFTLCFNFE